MHRSEVHRLDPTRQYWVPAVVAPERDWEGSPGCTRGARFMVVNIIGFLVNQFFVWLLVKQLGGPTWWPTIPIIFVTPLLTFALHRRFVYS